MNSTKVNRNYALDCIKVLATTFILFHHYQQISRAQYMQHPNFYFNEYFDWAWMVELFFVISGFFAFMQFPKDNISFGTYLGKKLKRLLPVMTCSVVVYCALNYLHMVIYQKPWFFNDIPNVWGIIVSGLGLQTGLGLNGYRLNNPLWFVSVLIQCYCLTYVVSKLSWKKKWPLAWMLIILLFVIQDLRSRSVEFAFMGYDTKRGYISFIVGGLVALFVSNYQITRPVKVLCAINIIVFIWFIIFAPGYIEAVSAFVFLFCPSLIILLQTDCAQRVFRHSIWQVMCEISFNTYVWHSPLQLFLTLVAPQFIYSQRLGHMYLFALLAWIIGTVSHFLLEIPLQKWLPRIAQNFLVRR